MSRLRSTRTRTTDDWKVIKEEYKDAKWEHYPTQYCSPDEKPNYTELYSDSPIQLNREQDWFQSTHPWCLSCYSSYVDICEDIRMIFELPLVNGSWTKDDLKEKVVSYVKEVRGKIMESPLQELVKEMEDKLLAIVDCITGRWFHHTHCYQKTKKDDTIDIDRADVNHLKFVTTLCVVMSPLIDCYQEMLTFINLQLKKAKLGPRVNILKTSYANILDICRRRIEHFASKKDQENVNIKNFETNTPKRSKKNRNKQSRVNKTYKLTKEQFLRSKNRRRNRDL
jgi:hypothetical protein